MLKESHQEETTYNQETIRRLQTELKKVKNRLDQLYLDKLDGKVSEGFWMEKSREWQSEQDRILDQMRAHQGADRRYYDDGLKLLELASKAPELYAKQPPEQKNKILEILLSNCTLEYAAVPPTFRKPFDLFAKGVETGKWGEWMDDYRTFWSATPPAPRSASLKIATICSGLNHFCANVEFLSSPETSLRIRLNQGGTALDSPLE